MICSLHGAAFAQLLSRCLTALLHITCIDTFSLRGISIFPAYCTFDRELLVLYVLRGLYARCQGIILSFAVHAGTLTHLSSLELLHSVNLTVLGTGNGISLILWFGVLSFYIWVRCIIR